MEIGGGVEIVEVVWRWLVWRKGSGVEMAGAGMVEVWR